MNSFVNRWSIAIAAGLAAIGPAKAFNPQPDPPARFAMVGFVAGQVVRLNVVAVPAVQGVLSNGPCRITLSFLDTEGVQLTPPVNLILHPGKAAHHDLVGLSLPPGRGERTQLLPAVQVQPNFRSEPACRGVAASVEIFDASGRTSVFFADPNLYLAR